MRQSGFGTRAAAAFVLSLSACRSLVEADIEYVDCFPEQGNPYVEQFDGKSFQELTQRCWKADNLLPSSYVEVVDEDLIIRPNGTALWAGDAAAPLIYLRFEGDFSLLARTELTTTSPPDHCALKNDAAGIALRTVNDGWATLLVTPHLNFAYMTAEWTAECADGPDGADMKADVTATRHGLDGPDVSEPKTGVGADAEVDIAVCRSEDQLTFYYRDVDEADRESQWKFLPNQHAIDIGPVDVGLTTTAESTMSGPEGHFNWVAVYGARGSDQCDFSEFDLPLDPP